MSRAWVFGLQRSLKSSKWQLQHARWPFVGHTSAFWHPLLVESYCPALLEIQCRTCSKSHNNSLHTCPVYSLLAFSLNTAVPRYTKNHRNTVAFITTNACNTHLVATP